MKIANNFYDAQFGHLDFTVNGKCSGCGECCTDMLPMTQSEINNIKSYIKKHNIQEHNYMPKTVKESINMMCPFRNEDKKSCDIYEVRPSICRAFLCRHSSADIRKNKILDFSKDYKVVFVRKEFFNSEADKSLIENFLLLKEVFGC